MSAEEPWLDSEVARAIGPVEFVCRPRPWAPLWRNEGPSVAMAASLFLLGLAGLSFLAPCRTVGDPADIPHTIWDHLRTAGLFIAGLACALILFLLIQKARREMEERLLVGSRGLAFWGSTRERIVLWVELGIRWKCFPVSGAFGRLVLQQADGSTIVIDDYFDDHRRVIARVIEELARTPERSQHPETDPSQAITEKEHGVAESGET
jgi:hypothetical protein